MMRGMRSFSEKGKGVWECGRMGVKPEPEPEPEYSVIPGRAKAITRNPVLYVIANCHPCEAIPVTIISDIVLTQRTRRTQRESVGWGKAGYYKRRRFFTTEAQRSQRKAVGWGKHGYNKGDVFSPQSC
jgi:hypothetical protein